jgi:serine/threonine-protein kinase
MTCLAKDPAKRPQSARELAQLLGALDEAGTWTDDDARQWWSQHVASAPH